MHQPGSLSPAAVRFPVSVLWPLVAYIFSEGMAPPAAIGKTPERKATPASVGGIYTVVRVAGIDPEFLYMNHIVFRYGMTCASDVQKVKPCPDRMIVGYA